MGTKIKAVNNFRKGLLELQDSIKSEVAKSAEESVDGLVVALKAATPVDTGNARDHWKKVVVDRKKGKFQVINEVPYITDLNRGSSKQAPAFFVETTALKFGKLDGIAESE